MLNKSQQHLTHIPRYSRSVSSVVSSLSLCTGPASGPLSGFMHPNPTLRPAAEAFRA